MKKFICSVIILTSLSFIAIGQVSRTSLADNYFQNHQFLAAAQVYEKIHLSEPQNFTITEKLVQCYLKLNNTENAEFWLDKAIQSNSAGTKHYLNYATILASNNKHDKAKEWLIKAYNTTPEKELLNWIDSYENINQFYADSSLYRIKKASFNSDQSDFSPAIYKTGIIFCSARDNGKILKYKYDFNNTWFIDLYHVKDSSSTPVKFNKRINTRYHEGPIAFNAAYDTIYFTRNHLYRRNKSNKNEINNLNIYFAALKDGKWGSIKGFPLNQHDFSVGHPTFISENVMIFASDMPGGYGGTDLYRTTRINGIWQTPVNLGKEINTSGNEMFPFIDDKGILYFASNGHPGLGGLDIFYSAISGNKYWPARNVGFPINSNKDDFGFIIKNNEGYFSSNRDGNSTNDNIYQFVATKKKAIRFLAKDENENTITDVDAFVYANSMNQSFQIKDLPLEFVWEYGKLEKAKFSKTGYLDQEINFHATDFHKIKNNDTLSITLIKVQEQKTTKPVSESTRPSIFKAIDLGQIIELDIKYDVNKAYINNDAADKLDILVTFMKENPTIKVELGSHSDSRGSVELNRKLSQKRAESAVDYIASKGIDESRLIAIGYGKNQLKIVNAKTEEEHHQNRRTTIKIVGN